ncbi:hypothetical protein PoB_003258500 [Plakobranchus ocellatus]|uniref:IgGFc-binding protein N-terminal domain-containing protein n=1 Tax=Plakobranchus ocellatus TaxID=259542 RepID=A0AAV4AFC4_9GAST|nr:hypothetical protein PoB_003258500 [Plakobranchus ocellatus]
MPSETPTGNKEDLRALVLSGANVVITFRDPVGLMITRIPDTYIVNSTDGEITFKMPLDVTYNATSDDFEVSYLSVKTTGEVEETSFGLSNEVSSAVVKHTHAQDTIVFYTQGVTCNHELKWHQDSSAQPDSEPQCLAKFASQGAGFSVNVLEDEDSITRVSKSDSVVVSTTGSRLMAVLGPQYYIVYATSDAFPVSSIRREIQLVNWDGREDRWTKEETGFSSRKSVKYAEPPGWITDPYWEEILNIDAEGKKYYTPAAEEGSVKSLAMSGYRMKIGVLIGSETAGGSWQILDIPMMFCQSVICDAFVISQYNATNPFTLGDSASDITRLQITEFSH